MNVHDIHAAPSRQEADACKKRRRSVPVAVYAKGGLQPGDRLLPLAEVERMTSAKKSWIYYRIGQGLFPRPIRLCAGRRVAWSERAIQAWIEAQSAGEGGLSNVPESNIEGEKV
ncbi:helix-turn-helix transcriptional regulator [Comamonas sp. Tr-654]|uniref:helix-turn-helix transcriptional regulator n=1 Tax=Comamonas sp. Tr-654 TaxID=2608341 RepID=UPI001423A96A|nr:AlpA family phage regulatory protein [Comamonas sp. Tr-654]NIF83531.1 AlpA family phage regulatory protein [Comamonas sp. Tr-654]